MKIFNLNPHELLRIRKKFKKRRNYSLEKFRVHSTLVPSKISIAIISWIFLGIIDVLRWIIRGINLEKTPGKFSHIFRKNF
jgi:hypothetical protein